MENDNTPRTTATSASEGRLKDSLMTRRRDIQRKRRNPLAAFREELRRGK